MRALSSKNTLSKIVLRNQIDKIRLLFRKDRESYLCFYRILGFYPRNIQLYEQALLHKSTSVRSDKGRPLNNERLEFLGDAILDAIVGDIVYKRFEGKREGFLTNTRSKIVQRETLNKLAVEIGLDKLIIGKNGTFVINPAYHIHTDFDRFEENCRKLERVSDPDLRSALYRKAVELYKGHLLPRIEHEFWHMQLDMYYQSLYLAITKGYARYKLEQKEYIDALREIKNAMQISPGDGELSMLSVLAAGYHGGRALARRYYEAAKKYLDSSQIAQIHAQLGF